MERISFYTGSPLIEVKWVESRTSKNIMSCSIRAEIWSGSANSSWIMNRFSDKLTGCQDKLISS